MVVNRNSLAGRAAAQETIVVITHSDTADAAAVTTQLLAPNGVPLTELSEKVWVAARNGLYTLNLSAPEPELAKGAPWTVHALLPPGAHNRGKPDVEQPPAVAGGRTTLIWRGTADPLIPIVWNYL